MKHILTLSLCAFMVVLLPSCKRHLTKAPEDIHRSFSAMYPDATMVEWESEAGNFTADFFSNDHEMAAKFDVDGKWIWSKTEVLLTEVPDEVFESVSDFDDHKWEVERVDHYTRSTGEKEYYRIEYSRDNSDFGKIAYIRPDGTVFRSVN